MSYYVNPHLHSCPWYPYAQLFGSPNVKWCEETLCHWISEPANTYSNIAYLIAAIYIFWRGYRSGQKELIYLAPAMFLMGAFSFIYHMSNNYLSQVFDFIGMYLFVYWLIILNLRRLKWVSRENQVPFMIAMCVVSTIILHILYMVHIKFQIIILFAAIAIVGTEYLLYKKDRLKENRYRAFIGGLVFIILAQAASLMDGLRIYCDPQNHWFQGHALWHVLAAIGLSIVVHHWEQFYYSEKAKMESEIDDIETMLEV